MWEIFARGYCAMYGILILQLVSSVQHNKNWKQIRWIPRIPSFRVIFGAEVIWINLNAKLGRLTVCIWQVEVFLTNSTEVCISKLVIFFLWKTIFDAFVNCSCVCKMNPKMKVLYSYSQHFLIDLKVLFARQYSWIEETRTNFKAQFSFAEFSWKKLCLWVWNKPHSIRPGPDP